MDVAEQGFSPFSRAYCIAKTVHHPSSRLEYKSSNLISGVTKVFSGREIDVFAALKRECLHALFDDTYRAMCL